MSPDVGDAVAEAFREEWGRVVAALIAVSYTHLTLPTILLV